jgi:hypothetical protein
MRWKTSHHGHDPRHMDLIAIIVLLVAIIAACKLVQSGPYDPSAANPTTVFAGQSVRW